MTGYTKSDGTYDFRRMAQDIAKMITSSEKEFTDDEIDEILMYIFRNENEQQE